MPFETNNLAKREKQYIVGRDRELQQFEQLLRQADLGINAQILHVYGTGGVGKSTVLRLCQDMAEEAGVCFLMLDSRDFVHTESGFCTALLKLLRSRVHNLGHPDAISDDVRKSCMTMIERLAEECRVVLALDTFEEMLDMEAWLRDRFIPGLPCGTVVLTAGRRPLKGAWIVSPAWRELIRQLPILHLNKDDCGKYAKLCGIQEEERIEYLWKRSKGHPLTLSMAVAAQLYESDAVVAPDTDWFEDMATLWLKEVPDDELRAVVEAASVLLRFNQELLSFVMEKEIPFQLFDQLKSLSFVRQSANGWQLHDLMSEFTSKQFRERQPDLYNRYKERSAYYYAKIIVASSGTKQAAWEIAQLFRYADIKVLKAIAGDIPGNSLYWEPVTESTLADAAAYLRWRENCEEGMSGSEIDPESGERFRIDYSAEVLRLSSGGIDVHELFRLAPESLKLLRGQDGRDHGLAVIVPIHSGTLSWLERDPISRPYFSSLIPEERSRLVTPRDRPAGWFMRTMDFTNVLDPASRTHGVHLIYSYMCMGGYSSVPLIRRKFPRRFTRSSVSGSSRKQRIPIMMGKPRPIRMRSIRERASFANFSRCCFGKRGLIGSGL
ncbi:AAA family ATPase [Paenibacillus hamazuiensis]|uniref:AAA family ATPase n=1 Tax=Paenibacillus hamazuiensis TaxID=2936508 RepID=UPI00200BAC9C|nr:AAA family ATPase [Paenibacillus hamazuiensis]